jgi:predicted transport protein
MMIIKDIPYELKVRFSELEKTIMNMKALKVGESVKAKIIGKEGQEYLLSFKGFRMKANIKFAVKVGEELNLTVKEVGENIKFELNQDIMANKIKGEIGKIVIENQELVLKLETVFKELTELLNDSKISEEVKNSIVKNLLIKLNNPEIIKILEQNISIFTMDAKESSIGKILKFFISNSNEVLSEPELFNQMEELIKSQQHKLKEIIKEQKIDIESIKNKIFESIKSEKGNEQIRKVLNDFFKATESIKEHNISVKEHGIANQNLSLVSFIVPMFTENKITPDYLKMEYEKGKKSKSYKLRTVSLILNMSKLGKIKIELKKVGRILRVDFVSTNRETLEILKINKDKVEKKILGYFDNVFFEFRYSKKELTDFFEEGFAIEGSSLDIKV